MDKTDKVLSLNEKYHNWNANIKVTLDFVKSWLVDEEIKLSGKKQNISDIFITKPQCKLKFISFRKLLRM